MCIALPYSVPHCCGTTKARYLLAESHLGGAQLTCRPPSRQWLRIGTFFAAPPPPVGVLEISHHSRQSVMVQGEGPERSRLARRPPLPLPSARAMTPLCMLLSRALISRVTSNAGAAGCLRAIRAHNTHRHAEAAPRFPTSVGVRVGLSAG